MTQTETVVSTDSEFLKKVRDILEQISVCMLCTHGDAAKIESRPMTLQAIDFHGNLWFFCSKDSALARQIEVDAAVTVAASNPQGHRCVVLQGKGRIVIDRARLQQLWKPELRTWFPQGLDDEQLSLLKVEVTVAEYWEWPDGAVAHVLNRIEAMMTGEESPLAVHEKKIL